MPRLTDREQIRNLLETDRPWAVYALADLEPGLFEHAHWFCPAGGEPALALFFAGFATPVLITVGKPHALRAVLGRPRGRRQGMPAASGASGRRLQRLQAGPRGVVEAFATLAKGS